jgi:hypothetical protein
MRKQTQVNAGQVNINDTRNRAQLLKTDKFSASNVRPRGIIRRKPSVTEIDHLTIVEAFIVDL